MMEPTVVLKRYRFSTLVIGLKKRFVCLLSIVVCLLLKGLWIVLLVVMLSIIPPHQLEVHSARCQSHLGVLEALNIRAKQPILCQQT